MTVEEIGNKLADFILSDGSVTYANIDRFFEKNNIDYRGSLALVNEDYPNIVYWTHWNQLAIDTYNYTMKKLGNKVDRDPCSEFVYLIDGCVLEMPLVKSVRQYKKPHWLPVVITKKKGK